MMCASVASFGKFGISNSAVCVEVIIVLLAVFTCFACFALHLFFDGNVGVMKVSLAPVSAISCLARGLSIVCDVAVWTIGATMLFLLSLLLFASFVFVVAVSHILLGSPRLQDP